ncbi:hypothetical protein ACOME3_009754 [Neoechinorhynchus agilis]
MISDDDDFSEFQQAPAMDLAVTESNVQEYSCEEMMKPRFSDTLHCFLHGPNESELEDVSLPAMDPQDEREFDIKAVFNIPTLSNEWGQTPIGSRYESIMKDIFVKTENSQNEIKVKNQSKHPSTFIKSQNLSDQTQEFVRSLPDLSFMLSETVSKSEDKQIRSLCGIN